MTENSPMLRMPPPLLRSTMGNTGISELVHTKLREAGPHSDAQTGMWGTDSTWLLGTILPPFQRAVVWDEARMVRFVESAWLGMHLGTYVVNAASDERMWRDDTGCERFHPTDLWLIDGQQRLTAIDRYLDNAFPVFDCLWGELEKREQRRFEFISFSKATIKLTDENELRELYDRMNFGGVAHTEEERALPRP